MRVLVTRPEPGASRTAARLAARGHAPLLAPLTVIGPLAGGPPPGSFDALALTSANAALHAPAARLGAALAGLPLHAVGAASARAARAAGYGEVVAPPVAEEGAGRLDGAALAARLVRAGARRVLYLAGTPRRPGFETALAAARVAVAPWEVYRARALDALPGAAHEALVGPPGAVLHASPRAAALFAASVMAAGLGVAAGEWRHICLSPAVAAALGPLGLGGAVVVAVRSDEAALLDALDLSRDDRARDGELPSGRATGPLRGARERDYR